MLFECDDCHISVYWSAQELVERGEPVCPKCDQEMKLLSTEEVWCKLCGTPIDNKNGDYDQLQVQLPDRSIRNINVCLDCYTKHNAL